MDSGSAVSEESRDAYAVAVHINFIPNLFLSTYDVDVSLDGAEQGKLKHGEDIDYEFELEQGEHSLVFTSSESSSVKGSISFEVSDDIEASYKITCHSDKIEVVEEYIVNKNAAGENEAMTPLSASDYRKKDYREIVQSLEEAGFTNVSAEPVYDIVWGITDEGSSDKISIDGKTDFKRGEVFKNDVEIVVTYHLKTEDDPSRVLEAESSSSSTTSSKPESSSSSTTSSKSTSSSSSTSSSKPESSSSTTSSKPESSSSTTSSKPASSSSSTTSSKPASSSSSTTSSKPISSSSSTVPASEADIPYVPAETQTTGIELISMTNPVRRNEDAQITIKGTPNTEYSIKVIYSSGASTADGLENKFSDSNGYVTWTWHVGGRTKLGDNKRVEIGGGGQTLKTTFSVVN
ncbi:MAG: hypothetical protein HDT43_06995 [Ruminococcaceae bacterium]|nr:hypothetical protein [Oscillospiraceae bacterium]